MAYDILLFTECVFGTNQCLNNSQENLVEQLVIQFLCEHLIFALYPLYHRFYSSYLSCL